ncbi:hypothetical protein V2W45_1341778 [Cenococcum geophilum]
MRNLSNRITLHSPSRSFSMELGSIITVIMATRLSSFQYPPPSVLLAQPSASDLAMVTSELSTGEWLRGFTWTGLSLFLLQALSLAASWESPSMLLSGAALRN